MIELYASGSPNVQKVILMLEEAQTAYSLRLINTYLQEQFSPEFTRLNPNNKVPVIVDHDTEDGQPFTVIESGAILIYLAEKFGILMPSAPKARYEVIQWLMFQMASVGPMFGQFNHFTRFAPEGQDYSYRRYKSETRRIYDVLETRLSQRAYVGCDSYSIADIAVFPWVRSLHKRFGEKYPFMAIPSPDFPNLARWFRAVAERPAVARALVVIDANPSPVWTATPEGLDRFFGRGKFERG